MLDPQHLSLVIAAAAGTFLVGYRWGQAQGALEASRRNLDERLHGMDLRIGHTATVANNAQARAERVEHRLDAGAGELNDLHERLQHLEEMAPASPDPLRRPLITPGPGRQRTSGDDTSR